MKIGFKPKSYNDVVCFEIDDEYVDKDQFMSELFSAISSESESDLDFIVTVSKKKINQTKGENETE